MNRRDFIKSAIIGAAGVSVPLPAISAREKQTYDLVDWMIKEKQRRMQAAVREAMEYLGEDWST